MSSVDKLCLESKWQDGLLGRLVSMRAFTRTLKSKYSQRDSLACYYAVRVEGFKLVVLFFS